VGKITEKAVGRSACLLIQRSKYGAMLSKIHSYRLLFQQFYWETKWEKLISGDNRQGNRKNSDLELTMVHRRSWKDDFDIAMASIFP